MKKSLLLGVALSAGLITIAQNGKLKPIVSPAANKAVVAPGKATDVVAPASQITTSASAAVGVNKGGQASVTAVVGATATPAINTTYDLQSNSATRNAIAIDPNTGQIATVTTFSPSPYNSAHPNRGTGYNNSSDGGVTWGALPTARLENSITGLPAGYRTGWPSIAYTATGEIIVAHAGAAPTSLRVLRRTNRGTGAWDSLAGALRGPDNSNGSLWPRIAASGNNVHMISVVNVGTTGATLQGVNGAITYCRSTDGGFTWDAGNIAGTNHSIIPGLDSNYFKGFGGDVYAIAAKGNTVAVVAADGFNGVRLAKSTDNGTTWTSQWVDSLPRRKYSPATGFPGNTSGVGGVSDFIGNDGIADTIYSNDESVAVTLDDNGMAHVFYGVARLLDDSADIAYDNYSYFPITDGLAYWREGMPANTTTDSLESKVIIAGMEDLNNNGQIDITAQVSGNTESILGGYRSASMTSMPSAYAANGSVYLVYSSIVESSLYQTGAGANRMFRHIYMMKSDDNGVTWSCPNDIMPDSDPLDSTTIQEGVWPSIAQGMHGGNLHLVYQRDYVPGNGLNGSPVTDPDNNGPVSEWLYSAINPADLTTSNLANYAGVTTPCQFNVGIIGMQEYSSIAGAVVSPNPTNGNATLKIELKNDANAVVSIYNMVGEVVSTSQVNGVLGYNTVNLNTANLNAGVYFVNVKVGNVTVSNKLVIQK